MSDNAAILERVSKVLGVPQKELVRKGLQELLLSQLRTCSAEIAEIKTKYNVKTVAELEKKVEEGTVEEHPALGRLDSSRKPRRPHQRYSQRVNGAKA